MIRTIAAILLLSAFVVFAINAFKMKVETGMPMLIGFIIAIVLLDIAYTLSRFKGRP